MKKLIQGLMAGALTVAVSSAAMAASDNNHRLGDRSIFSERAIEQRIDKIGEVCMEGEDCVGGGAAASDGGASAPAQVASGPRDAETIYNTKCMACHATGAAGAPKTGDAAAWSARMEQGMDTVVQHAINGLNAMPPKGTCMDCSDEEIEATVKYMVEQSQ